MRLKGECKDKQSIDVSLECRSVHSSPRLESQSYGEGTQFVGILECKLPNVNLEEYLGMSAERIGDSAYVVAESEQ